MLSERQQFMVDLLDKRGGAEIEGDLEATMADEPHLHNVVNKVGWTQLFCPRRCSQDV
jgi:hypothetical protein